MTACAVGYIVLLPFFGPMVATAAFAFYGINGFVGVGLFFLASREDLKIDPKGYEGYEVVPMDLTADIGIKVDTEI